MRIKIGHGYDVHAFTAGDGFVLGGIEISCDRTVVAHSCLPITTRLTPTAIAVNFCVL
jgi:hypothetical protein